MEYSKVILGQQTRQVKSFGYRDNNKTLEKKWLGFPLKKQQHTFYWVKEGLKEEQQVTF